MNAILLKDVSDTMQTTDQFQPGLGVYLFLGYSRADMKLMGAYNHMTEIKALDGLESLLKKKYGFKVSFVIIMVGIISAGLVEHVCNLCLSKEAFIENIA